MHFLRIDGPVFRFLETIANLLLLNLLFVICCIPVVTIGPALTATYYVALKIVRQEETGIFQDLVRTKRLVNTLHLNIHSLFSLLRRKYNRTVK